MTKLIFIRHAETDMAGTFCGHSDPELNANGFSQLPDLIDELRCWPIQEVYSSDLRRAKQTAQAIAAHFHVECHIRKELREIHFGRWEGLRWSEVETREPEEAQRWIQEYPNRSFPDGEATQAFAARISKEVRFYLEEGKGGTLAVVTHAGFIRVALMQMFGVSEEKAWDCTRKYGSVILVNPNLAMERRPVEESA